LKNLYNFSCKFEKTHLHAVEFDVRDISKKRIKWFGLSEIDLCRSGDGQLSKS